MAFRIGRKYAQHSYPETGQSGVTPFAYNYAIGPATSPLGMTQAGTTITWTRVESTGLSSTGNVPITPEVTGRVRITATVEVQNQSELSAQDAAIHLLVNGTPVASFANTIPASLGGGNTGLEVISFTFDLVPPAALAVGATANISLVALSSTDDVALSVVAATIDIQERQVATG